MESLSSDLGRVMNYDIGKDVTMICRDGSIRAHRCILSVRSPVFQAMFESGMIEKGEGEVKIEEAEADVVRQLVKFMYKASIDDDFTRVEELLVLANKYQMVELVNLCANKISMTMSEENALDLGIFGETHNSEVLMDLSTEYISTYMNKLLREDWKNKMRKSPDLMMQIIQNLRPKISCICQKLQPDPLESIKSSP